MKVFMLHWPIGDNYFLQATVAAHHQANARSVLADHLAQQGSDSYAAATALIIHEGEAWWIAFAKEKPRVISLVEFRVAGGEAPCRQTNQVTIT